MIRVLLSLPKHITTEAKNRKRQKEIEKQHKEYEERLIDSRIKVGALYVKKEQCYLRRSTIASPGVNVPEIWEIVSIEKDNDGWEEVHLKNLIEHHCRTEYRNDLKEKYINANGIFDIYGGSLLEDYDTCIKRLQETRGLIRQLCASKKGKD